MCRVRNAAPITSGTETLGTNIFKGMRRLALVIGIAGAGYAIDHARSQHTYLQLGYRVTATGRELVKSLDCPSLDDGVYRQFYRTAEGNEFQARICFPSMRSTDGFEMRIPWPERKPIAYRVDSREAELAMRAFVADHFRLSPDELVYANQAYLAQRDAERSEKLVDIGLFLTLYFGAATAIGWIARGFLGIPYGSDRRQSPPP